MDISKRKLADWDEQDLVYARKWYYYLQRKGETRRIKRLMHKRWRREDKALVCRELTEALKEDKLEEQPNREENK